MDRFSLKVQGMTSTFDALVVGIGSQSLQTLAMRTSAP